MRSVSTPTTTRKRGASDKTKTATRQKTTARQKTAAATKSTAAKATAGTAAKSTKAVAKAGKPVKAMAGGGKRSFTVTVPTAGRMAGGLMDAALLPVAVARRWLPAKGGLPLYVGLGLLGAADAIEWPVAVGIGVGYAVLRRGGVMAPPSTGRRTIAQAA
ncbi:hypothetical protein [Streptomyces bingchenggensis]|uniref:hypothetical protein n=1 Tax=Streptomyces bingchenggensis TaxID=379067 RepID=UPI00130DCF04|nr:hypothetical protein [Streptomyces bingchenggensis]